ncbi:MAG: LiaI-LiaF-like domain-containing protein [Acidobacteriota bacterium]
MSNNQEEKYKVKKQQKSPALAGILAFFFPIGTGALYNGQLTKALFFFLGMSGLITLQTSGRGQPFLALCLAGFYIYQFYDAVHSAELINRRDAGKEIEKPAETLEEIPEPVRSGSIFWGIVLIILGGLLLMANYQIIDYDTLFDFWPLVIIVIGVKFVVDYAAKNKGN